MHLFYGLFFNKEVLLTQTIITNKVGYLMHTLQYGLRNLLTIIMRDICCETKEDKITEKAGLNPQSHVFRSSINSYAILILAVVQ